jgi:L-amino acid N-acyltransferase YncA
MQIRDADADRDSAACAEIYSRFVRETAISFEAEPPSVTEMARRITGTSSRYPWLVAELDGAVAGYAYASAFRERAAYRWAVEVTVYVDGSHHRRGIGRALYESLFERLAAQGFRMACGGITLPNPASVALHESVGFEPVGVYRAIGWKFGRWHDVAWYQRALRPDGPDPPAEPAARRPS